MANNPNQFIVGDRLLTEQDAIVACLRACGLAAINSLVDVNNRSAQMAAGNLYTHDIVEQTKGWSWNMAYNVALSPDVNGLITLPDNLLWFTPTQENFSENTTYRTSYQLAARGDRLYNVSVNTFVFSTPVSLDLCTRQPWDNLPPAYRVYITAKAAKDLNASTLRSASVERSMNELIATSLVALEQVENKYQKANPKGNRGQVYRRLHGRGGRRRNRAIR